MRRRFLRGEKGGRLTSSAGDSPVSLFPMSAGGEAPPMPAGSGPSSPVLLACFNPDGSWSRTSLDSAPSIAARRLLKSCKTWPDTGMMRSGRAYLLPSLVPHTSATGSSLWPTPTKADGERGSLQYQGNHNPTLLGAVRRRWSTPRSSPSENRQTKRTPSRESSRHGLSLAAEVGGQLNPVWVNWLMNFPLTWHAESVSEVLTWIEIFLGWPRGSLDGCLGSNPTAMPSFPPLRNGSASKSSRRKKRD